MIRHKSPSTARLWIKPQLHGALSQPAGDDSAGRMLCQSVYARAGKVLGCGFNASCNRCLQVHAGGFVCRELAQPAAGWIGRLGAGAI